MILSHLSTRVTNFIVNGDGLERLEFLLRFLLAWKKRPDCLTKMAYGWCSDFFKPAGSGAPFQTQRQDIATGRINPKFLPPELYPSSRIGIENAFGYVGPLCDLIRSGNASHHIRERPQEWATFRRQKPLLFMILKVGFRLASPGTDLRLDHTPHCDLVFKHAFSSGNDEVIADAVCAWMMDKGHMLADSCVHYLADMLADSCVHYLAERMAKGPPFSPRLQQICVSLIKRMVHYTVFKPETIYLLNRLNLGMDDMSDRILWASLLVRVICSPAGFRDLSIHYWHLMEELPHLDFPIARAMELARLLEKAEDWEKLEAWMVVAWRVHWRRLEEPTRLEILECLKQVTLKHLRRRPSALPRFEAIPRLEGRWPGHYTALEDICTQVQAEQLPLEPPPP